jgi:hypothetical protein
MTNKATSGFVYLWYDRKHKRYYIGSHWGHESDRYLCSSRWMKKSYKRRPEDFKRRIISKVNTNRADLLKEEQRWLDMIKPEEIKVRYYNLIVRADHLWHSNEGRRMTIGEKISATKTGQPDQRTTPMSEIGRKISESKKGVTTFTSEHREKLRQAKLGKKLSAEHRQRMVEGHQQAK